MGAIDGNLRQMKTRIRQLKAKILLTPPFSKGEIGGLAKLVMEGNWEQLMALEGKERHIENGQCRY